jgi:hypothetical protein
MMNALLFWLILALVFFLAYTLGTQNALRLAAQQKGTPPVPKEALDALESKLLPLLAVTRRKVMGNAFEFDGILRGRAEETFRGIREAFSGGTLKPLLLEGEENEVRVLLVPKQQVEQEAAQRPKWWLHWLLFAATFATTTWAWALHAGVNLLEQPWRLAVGLPYSLGLMLILGSHELGHYFSAKAHGIKVTPPYFIPVPFALGTFGAFIKIQSLTPNRRAMFDVAVAGPLAGLVIAIPALLIGLRLSQVIPGNVPESLGNIGVNIGSSVLLAFLAKMSLGASIIQGDHLLLHPLAFAGWLGLIVTALNLLPIGQLDGGHMSHALFGSRKAHDISLVALVALFLMALFVWPGLMFWAFIVFFIAGTRDTPSSNDVTPVNPWRKALGYFTFLLFLLIIMPVPRAFYQLMGIHSPYM